MAGQKTWEERTRKKQPTVLVVDGDVSELLRLQKLVPKTHGHYTYNGCELVFALMGEAQEVPEKSGILPFSSQDVLVGYATDPANHIAGVVTGLYELDLSLHSDEFPVVEPLADSSAPTHDDRNTIAYGFPLAMFLKQQGMPVAIHTRGLPDYGEMLQALEAEARMYGAIGVYPKPLRAEKTLPAVDALIHTLDLGQDQTRKA